MTICGKVPVYYCYLLSNHGELPEGYLHGLVHLLVDGDVHLLVLALQDALLL